MFIHKLIVCFYYRGLSRLWCCSRDSSMLQERLYFTVPSVAKHMCTYIYIYIYIYTHS